MTEDPFGGRSLEFVGQGDPGADALDTGIEEGRADLEAMGHGRPVHLGEHAVG
jgi:hypothetical protein